MSDDSEIFRKIERGDLDALKNLVDKAAEVVQQPLVSPDELRIYIVVRTDLEMSRPKFGVQVAHAALAVFIECLNHNPDRAWAYWDSGKQAKIVLQVKNTKQLLGLVDKAKELGIFTETITDAGRTEFSEPTLTCAGFGPLWYQREGAFLKRVRLYPNEKKSTILDLEISEG